MYGCTKAPVRALMACLRRIKLIQCQMAPVYFRQRRRASHSPFFVCCNPINRLSFAIRFFASEAWDIAARHFAEIHSLPIGWLGAMTPAYNFAHVKQRKLVKARWQEI